MKSKDILNNRLVRNIISLFVLQGSNYIFPLITFPYLVRTLGTELYGVLIFCTALMSLLNIIIDYGFNITGTREISINKNNKLRVNELYNIIINIKLIFMTIIGIVYLIVLQISPYFSEHKSVFVVSFLMLLGNCIFPIWFFQGLEQMKYITYLNIVAKVIVTIFIFILIKRPTDLTLAAFLQTLYYLIPGVASLFLVKYKFNVKFKIIFNRHKIISELLNGRYVFMTNLWINIYGQGSLLILGVIAGNHATGNYGVGQKIMSAFYGLAHPAIQAIYPYSCELYAKSKELFNKFSKKILCISFLCSFFISILLLLFTPQLVVIVTGSYNAELNILVKLFSVIVFLGVVNTVIARLMYAMNLQQVLNKNYFKAAIVFLIGAIPLTLWMNEYGMSIVVMIVEGLLLFLNIRYLFMQAKQLEMTNK